ncbi:MAG: transposase [Candidatus Helarchaeota archaeon]|nr:transposase [Candidatus Helarchaeota archaeon]
MKRLVDYYKNHRFHESLNNLIPADAYSEWTMKINSMREPIKQKIMKFRRI